MLNIELLIKFYVRLSKICITNSQAFLTYSTIFSKKTKAMKKMPNHQRYKMCLLFFGDWGS